ncbi:unnamed protein product [Vitrella brassicaformis CCMP3155]|uniref:Uncharacterized protein n=1 Tax=Vitrella brassicaformis (strain CCMP3155) TaxID=1169540 RepID=A0A0G4FIA6_VITBC|nr:unnamed protein product [Vitrella brassicaformis CCMP3155]|eukprot:CEM13209.1 unnamed protein product [Vitrella brassicaformis CCMP3155]
MFAACCACEQPGKGEAVTQISFDQHDHGKAYASAFSEDEPEVLSSATPRVEGTGASGNDKREDASRNDVSQTSGAYLTQEEKQREKDRLQMMVKAFARAAVVGVKCHFVKEPDTLQGAGQVVEATYYLTESLKHMIITGPDATRNIPLTTISDVVFFEESKVTSNACFRVLTREEKSRAIDIEYDSGEGSMTHLVLLTNEGGEDRENVITSLKILRLYSLAGTPKTTPRA